MNVISCRRFWWVLKTNNKYEINDMLHVGHIWSQILPRCSMSGIFTYILAYCTIHGSYGHAILIGKKPKHQNHQPPTLVGPSGKMTWSGFNFSLVFFFQRYRDQTPPAHGKDRNPVMARMYSQWEFKCCFLDCSDATKSHELLYMDFMFCC